MNIEARRLGHALGAEILGVDMREPVESNTVAAIRSIWHEYHVVALRDQNASPDDILAFARAFGNLEDHASTPHYRMEDRPELLEISTRQRNGKPSETRNVGRNWHSDYAYTPNPAAASLLYCVERPPVGGDTMFCNMVHAYETLSDKMREIVDGLYSVYDINLVAGFTQRDQTKTDETRRLNPPIAHSAVRVHPESGRRALYVSERVSHFHGMTPEESQPLIKFLCAHATAPENVYRHVWREGDLICWDNRTTMHVALTDFDQSQNRHMLRATLVGGASGFVIED